MGLSEEADVFIGFAAGLLVGFSLSGMFKLSFFGLSEFLWGLIELAYSTPYGYFVRILFLAVTLLFVAGAILRFRENGIAIFYTFLIGFFVTFL